MAVVTRARTRASLAPNDRKPAIDTKGASYLETSLASTLTTAPALEPIVSSETRNPTGAVRKRKVSEVIDLTADDEDEVGHVGPTTQPPPRKKAKRQSASKIRSSKEHVKKAKAGREEKRLKPWLDEPPAKYEADRYRALSQRMFVLDRRRTDTDDCPAETIKMAGSTGNVYTITIDRKPRCNCPAFHFQGMNCKHLIYVLARVLKASPEFQYQRALLASEVTSILYSAPPIPAVDASEYDGSRKPIEGDCPICVMEMELTDDKLVCCKAACGNNFHSGCFDQWAATKRAMHSTVTCPFCRSEWADVNETAVSEFVVQGERGVEGFINIASRLGLVSKRDTSTYRPGWQKKHRQPVEVGEADYISIK